MIVDDLISALIGLRSAGRGDEEVGIVHASTPHPEVTRPQSHSGRFPLLTVDLNHGVNLIESCYIERYVEAVFPDMEREA